MMSATILDAKAFYSSVGLKYTALTSGVIAGHEYKTSVLGFESHSSLFFDL
jgi:hypothetical protein